MNCRNRLNSEMKAPTSNKPQVIIAARKVSVGYISFISKHPDSDEYREINILRDSRVSQSLLTRKCSPRERNSVVRKRGYIRRIENKPKNIPIYRIRLLSKIISDAVDVGVVDEWLMRGIDLLFGNYLAGNKVRRSYQNNQEARGKSKFRPTKEKKTHAATGAVTHCVGYLMPKPSLWKNSKGTI